MSAKYAKSCLLYMINARLESSEVVIYGQFLRDNINPKHVNSVGGLLSKVMLSTEFQVDTREGQYRNFLN